MTIEKRLERLEAILDARGLDWDHPRVEEPAKEALLDGLPDLRTFAQPNLRWRILLPGELIKQGDWACPKSAPYCNDPVKGNGWIMTGACGLPVRKQDVCVYARPVVEEPASEKPPEPEYREPVLPSDAGKECEFNDGGTIWVQLQLTGWLWYPDAHGWISAGGDCWRYCRIKKDS